MASSSVSGYQLRGIAFAVVILASFAAIWGLNGSAGFFGRTRTLTTALVLLVTLIWFGVAFWLHRTAGRLPATSSATSSATPNLFRTRAFWLAVLAEAIAIPAISRLLISTGHPDAVMSAVAAIVGLHFFILIPALDSWRFGFVGGAMVLLAAFSLTLPASLPVAAASQPIALRVAVVGLGCAVLLWAGILLILAGTHRQVALHRA